MKQNLTKSPAPSWSVYLGSLIQQLTVGTKYPLYAEHRKATGGKEHSTAHQDTLPVPAWLIHSFTYSFSQLLSTTYSGPSYVPGSGPGPGHTDMNSAEPLFSIHSVLWRLSSSPKVRPPIIPFLFLIILSRLNISATDFISVIRI